MRFQFFFAAFLFFALTFSVLAQDSSDDIYSNVLTEAIKLGEMGRAGECEIGAWIDGVYLLLSNNPNGKAYIIVYRGSEDLPSAQTEAFVQKQIGLMRRPIAFRKYDASLITFIDGGFRKSDSVVNEFWVVPEGGEIPKPSNTVEKPQSPKDKAYQVEQTFPDLADAFIEQNPQTTEEIEIDETVEPVEANEAQNEESTEDLTDETYFEEADKFYWVSDYFVNLLQADKTVQGVLIFYADDEEYDLVKARQSIENDLQEYSKKEKIDLSRVKIVFGGYHGYPKAEFWIVPKNAKEPTPAPQERKTVQENV
jgi:hypothetical protein